MEKNNLENHLISIVMPAYNAEKYIARTIDCILEQTYTNWELIIVNDGSTDNSLTIIKDYANRDSRIRYVTIDNTGSARKPRLVAASMSCGEYICNIDSDDLVEKDYLRILYEDAIFCDADVVCPVMEYTDESGSVYQKVPNFDFEYNKILSGKEAAYLTFKCGCGSQIACNGMLCKRGMYDFLIKDIDDSSLYVYQDEVDWLKLLFGAQRVFLSKARYIYIRNKFSVTHTINVKTYDKLLTEINYRDFVIENYNDLIVRNAINQRFLDVLYIRRMKYLSQCKYFSREQREEIDGMFNKAYSAVDRTIKYKFPKMFLFCGGYNLFKILTRLIFCLRFRVQ